MCTWNYEGVPAPKKEKGRERERKEVTRSKKLGKNENLRETGFKYMACR